MDDAEERRRALGYKQFSDYISYLISADVAERPMHKTVRTEKVVIYERLYAGNLNEEPPSPVTRKSHEGTREQPAAKKNRTGT